MPYRDPKCVYVADDFGTAGLVVSWLASHDIEAVIMDEATQGGLEGLTWLAPGRVSTRGLEVWAATPEQAARGRDLLADKASEIKAAAAERATRTGHVAVTCEACGTTAEFPLARAGRTENCPGCRAYLDVPDPDAPPDDEYWKEAGEGEPPG